MSSSPEQLKKKASPFSLAEDCGRFFEVGFNIGILTYISHHQDKFSYSYGDLYQNYLSRLSFAEMLKSAYKRHRFPAAVHKRKIGRQWFLFFLQKGFLAGLTFMQEFHASLVWDADIGPIEIAYYQCSFSGDNSISTLPLPDEEEWAAGLAQLTAYGIDPERIDFQQHKGKGKFLHADTLMLLHYGAEWRILCVDLSIFSVTTKENMKDPEDVQTMFHLLTHELSYHKSKSVFSNLSIDTAASKEKFAFSSGLETYITAFKREDKESAKLIQAGSYVHDFYTFLCEHHIIDRKTPVHVNIIGYTDRNVNSMSLSNKDFAILATCSKIYTWEPGEETIQDARMRVLETIRANAAYSFQTQGEEFTQRIVDVAQGSDGVHWIEPGEEWIEGFANGWDLLTAGQLQPEVVSLLGMKQIQQGMTLLNGHQELVLKALEPESLATFLFLTGNPGIGKTTAVAKFLQEHSKEGFLFLYVSPRKLVNLDIIKKFRADDGEGPLWDDTLAITTNANLIHDNGGELTVMYYSPHLEGHKQRQSVKKEVHFLDEQSAEALKHHRSSRLETLSEDRIWEAAGGSSGVMSSICDGLYVNLHEQLSNQLVATVALQSLKKTSNGNDTLVHLDKIFSDMVNQKKKVIPAEMQKLAERIKHIFIMIDEITGDDGGVAFLEGITSFVRRFQLLEHGFNTKIIVADASIVDKRVISQHLSESSYEPDKIYFCEAKEEDIPPLTQYELEYAHKKALVINANAYPARRLHMTYHVCMECLEYDEETFNAKREQFADMLQQKIKMQIVELWKRPDVPQIIIYIQDKRRLVQLIETLREEFGFFEDKKDYLEIHANISEASKKEIKEHSKKVRIVFMTASASRGLSFPRATHILIDVPRFEIEQNLMEIIQVIYRSRGDKVIDTADKHLSFYFSDRAIYYEGDRALSLRESTLNILNILLVLKASIMTRIQGYGQIGQQRLMIIPIGGKSVLAAGETYIGKIGQLINELRKESDRRSGAERKFLKDAYIDLRNLLGQAELRVTNTSDKKAKRTSTLASESVMQTYLSQRTTFANRFEDAVYSGFDRLLHWTPMETGYMAGGLLVVPMINKKVKEDYLLDVGKRLRQSKDDVLWRTLRKICVSHDYSENIQSLVRDALDLIDVLDKTSPEKIQQFSQDSQHADQYYAIPLFTFIHNESMKAYFDTESDDDLPFKQLLIAYVRAFYPITNVLPIGEYYRDFPFITFRSFNLQEIRNKIFSDNHLLISHEMNILNMLLSYKK